MKEFQRRYLREQADWAASAPSELTEDECADARADIDAEVRAVLNEATNDGQAHGVSTLSALLVGYSPDTIRASLGRLEASGMARRDECGFDHLDENEDGWWYVITDAERRETDAEISRMVEDEV